MTKIFCWKYFSMFNKYFEYNECWWERPLNFFKDLKKKKRKKDRKKKVTLTLTAQRVEKILHRLFILRQTCWWLLSSEALGFQSEPKSLKILLIFFIPTKSTNLHCKGSNCGVIMHYKKATTPKETFNHRITKTKPYCRTNYFIISLHHSIVHSNSLSTLCKHIYSTPTPQKRHYAWHTHVANIAPCMTHPCCQHFIIC